MTTYSIEFTTRNGFKVLEVFEHVGADNIVSAHLLPTAVTVEFDAASRDHAEFIARHAQRTVSNVDTFTIRRAKVGA
jgi:hypothetical protein